MPTVTCPHCSRQVKLREGGTRKTIKCPNCSQTFPAQPKERRLFSILASISMQLAIGGIIACGALIVLLEQAQYRAQNAELGKKNAEERAQLAEKRLAEMATQLETKNGAPGAAGTPAVDGPTHVPPPEQSPPPAGHRRKGPPLPIQPLPIPK